MLSCNNFKMGEMPTVKFVNIVLLSFYLQLNDVPMSG